MAYVPQNQDEEETGSGMNVLGNQGINQPAQPQQEEAPQATQSSGSALIGNDAGTTPSAAPNAPGKPSDVSTNAPSNQPKKNVGSGLFTDLRKYVKANEGGGANIAQNIQQKSGQQAQQLGQQVQQQQSQFQQRVNENRGRQEAAQNFAQQQIQQAGTVEANPDDVARFRDLATNAQTYEEIDPFDLSKQNVEAERLARQAALASRASGTNQLLSNTFGNNKYTRGQQSLDELILSGAQPERRQLVEQLQGQAEGLTGQIRDARTGAIAEAQGLKRSAENLRGDIANQLGQAREGLTSEVEAEVASRREALTAQQQGLVEALNSGEITEEQLAPFLDQEALDAVVNQRNIERNLLFNHQRVLSNAGRLRENSLSYQGQLDEINNLAKKLGTTSDEIINFGKSIQNKDLQGSERYRQLQNAQPHGGLFSVDNPLTRLYLTDPDRASRLGISKEFDPNIYAGNLRQTLIDSSRNNNIDKNTIINQFLNETNSREGIDLGSYLQGTDPETINAENVITDDQIARQNALAALAGRAGIGIRKGEEASTSPGTFNLLEAMRRLGLA